MNASSPDFPEKSQSDDGFPNFDWKPEELLAHACERLRGLAQAMLRNYPLLRRWEETDDLLQNGLIGLHRALSNSLPTSTEHFFRLASRIMRQELIDLARRVLGPQGIGGNHASVALVQGQESGPDLIENQPVSEGEPESLAEWTEFHERIEDLPEEARQAFDLLYYQGLRVCPTSVIRPFTCI